MSSRGSLFALPRGLAHEEAIARELAGLNFDERQVQVVVAHLRSDHDLLARFRATAPSDEDAALREAACALPGMAAAIPAGRPRGGAIRASEGA